MPYHRTAPDHNTQCHTQAHAARGASQRKRKDNWLREGGGGGGQGGGGLKWGGTLRCEACSTTQTTNSERTCSDSPSTKLSRCVTIKRNGSVTANRTWRIVARRVRRMSVFTTLATISTRYRRRHMSQDVALRTNPVPTHCRSVCAHIHTAIPPTPATHTHTQQQQQQQQQQRRQQRDNTTPCVDEPICRALMPRLCIWDNIESRRNCSTLPSARAQSTTTQRSITSVRSSLAAAYDWGVTPPLFS